MSSTLGKLEARATSMISKPVLGLALAAAFAAACAGGTSSMPGTGGSGGSSAGMAGNSAGGGNGGNAAGGTSGGGTSGAAGNSGSGGSATGTGGSTGGSTGSGGNSTGGSGGGAAGSSGGNVGSGGSATGGTAGGAQAGRGGSSAGSGGASAGSGGRGGSGTGGTTGTGGAGGGASGCSCPSNATFCNDFETNALPAGAVYMVNAAPGDWSRDFAVDATQHKCGSSSLRVKSGSGETGTSGSQYQMLAVPVPTGAFWVRFWIESDAEIGGSHPHNAFAGTSPTATPNDPLDSFAEDVGVSFHTLDSDVTWPAGYGRIPNTGNTNPYTLPAMTWACVEVSYDLASRHQQLYINGALLIDATNYPPMASYSGTFGMFKFGFDSFNGPPRKLWYDSVAVAPTRIGGCN